jgi:hypothetical protein
MFLATEAQRKVQLCIGRRYPILTSLRNVYYYVIVHMYIIICLHGPSVVCTSTCTCKVEFAEYVLLRKAF